MIGRRADGAAWNGSYLHGNAEKSCMETNGTGSDQVTSDVFIDLRVIDQLTGVWFVEKRPDWSVSSQTRRTSDPKRLAAFWCFY